MNLKKKVSIIGLNLIPILIMIALIPVIINDYMLTVIYSLIVIISLIIKYEKNEYILLIFGLLIMIVSESFFISTGVETFNRTSLFGIMPLWLPVLWSYVFVVMKRVVLILNF